MIILGLGSNVADRLSYLDAAVKRLDAIISDMRLSGVYESKALLPEGAPDSWDKPFLNMAVAGTCDLPAHRVLAHLKALEAELGRATRGKWGPREIDIDILAFGDQVMSSDRLRIPHPELLSRDFALLPLCELAPDWRYPVEGAYYGWRACDIARDKGFSTGAQLRLTDIFFHD